MRQNTELLKQDLEDLQKYTIRLVFRLNGLNSSWQYPGHLKKKDYKAIWKSSLS